MSWPISLDRVFILDWTRIGFQLEFFALVIEMDDLVHETGFGKVSHCQSFLYEIYVLSDKSHL